jgi:hypothetical protein
VDTVCILNIAIKWHKNNKESDDDYYIFGSFAFANVPIWQSYKSLNPSTGNKKILNYFTRLYSN